MTRNEQLDLSQLNPEQHAAVTHGAGPLLIVAGPGSGKTRVITHRIAWLIQEQGVDPGRILAVTFTRRAAQEMQARLTRLVGGLPAQQMWLGTFHHLCVRMLRVRPMFAEIPNRFTILDQDDQRQVVRRATANLRLDPRVFLPKETLKEISSHKRLRLTPSTFADQAQTEYDSTVARIWEAYEAENHAAGALDFDDVLIVGYRLLAGPASTRLFHKKFLHTLVDEFQDVDDLQYDLMRGWSAGSGNVTVVGDPDQAIYSWRGAGAHMIDQFREDHASLTEVELNTNYRSTQQILDVANAVMLPSPGRKPRELTAISPPGEKPRLDQLRNEGDEARYLADQILMPESGGSHRPSEVLVLYRTNAQSRPVEEALIRSNVPYRIIGAPRFYEREEIRDLIAYLRLVWNPTEHAAFLRIVNTPRRGVGKRSLLALTQWAAEHDRSLVEAARFAVDRDASSISPPTVSRRAVNGLRRFLDVIDQAREIQERQPLDAALKYIIDEIRVHEHIRHLHPSDASDRWENIQELLSVAARYADMPPGTSLEAFLTDIALFTEVREGQPDEVEGITLATIHRAKGLEFPAVFVIGCEDGLLPHSRSITEDKTDRVEEERRLLYVAITRAERFLYLTHTLIRTNVGPARIRELSSFLTEVPDTALTITTSNAHNVGTEMISSRSLRPLRDDDQSDAARPGDQVTHQAFGSGVVIAVKPLDGDAEITVQFEAVGMKHLRASLAPLQKS